MLGCRKNTETEMQTQIQTSILSNVAGLCCRFLYNKLLLSCQPFNNYKEKRYSHEKLNKTVIVQSNLIIGNSMSNLEAVHNRQGRQIHYRVLKMCRRPAISPFTSTFSPVKNLSSMGFPTIFMFM
jgi:hypothetical protein